MCGGRGPQWPVEADEAWAYDDGARRQTHRAVIALCPDCHHVRHWGRTRITGGKDAALSHMMAVNGWNEPQTRRVVDEAFAQWELRSRLSWTVDYDW